VYTQAQPEGPNQDDRGEVDCRMDHSTKEENELFHKICKWVVPQKQKTDRSTNTKMDHSTKTKMDHSTKTNRKRSFHRDRNGKVC
jgi:hypothetical protein